MLLITYAKVVNFKQITTVASIVKIRNLAVNYLCKGSKFQANHNDLFRIVQDAHAVNYLCKGSKFQANHNSNIKIEKR